MFSKRSTSMAGKLFAIVASFSAAGSMAADRYDVRDFGDAVPSKEELIESLKPDTPSRGISQAPIEKHLPEKKAVSLSGIRFAFDSYTLTNEAQQVLRTVGDALMSPELGSYKFLVEGHTDSVGSDSYNQELSEKRAEAAKNYLVGLGVEHTRLYTIGKGEQELIDPQHPDSGRNRRVQFVNLE